MVFRLFVCLTAVAINLFTCPSSTFCENQRKGKKFEEGPFPPEEVAGLHEGAQWRLTSSPALPPPPVGQACPRAQARGLGTYCPMAGY